MHDVPRTTHHAPEASTYRSAVSNPSCLLVVADYRFVSVAGQAFAEIPWDGALARQYQPRFSRILLLGRFRRADRVPPAGWFAVDATRYDVLDAGDWTTPLAFLRQMPAIWARLRTEWDRVAVLHLKLFYLTSLLAWVFNRTRTRENRRPVATLLVGDAADAVLLRRDLLPLVWTRRMAGAVVGAILRGVQRRVELAGFVGQFLADRFGTPGRPSIIANESWLHQDQLRLPDRPAPRRPATVLFVGRLISRKRPDHFLLAVARLTGEWDLRCVLVGDGPERPALERQADELGLAGRTTFTGWLGLLTPAMLAVYDASDIFCLPSFAEGVPLVVIEAMGRGVPVVATSVSGTPELVIHEQSGLLVPRDDVEALAAAIRRYLEDADLWRRCARGGHEVARRNTFEAQRGRLAVAISGLAP
ncbi:MAG: glycosyltransferase family 4 protein [Gemmatimonadetes bacterium]|nr:glycosyltransferase family 4 protein [Gemmatimonadota bacterium]